MMYDDGGVTKWGVNCDMVFMYNRYISYILCEQKSVWIYFADKHNNLALF